MQTFAADPQCKATALTAAGKGITARMIQRHYLEQAERDLGKGFMPPWAPEVCRQWRAMLNRLAGTTQSVAANLDWAIKLAIFRDWTEQNGIAWKSLSDWAHVMGRLVAALGQTPYKDKSVTIEFILRRPHAGGLPDSPPAGPAPVAAGLLAEPSLVELAVQRAVHWPDQPGAPGGRGAPRFALRTGAGLPAGRRPPARTRRRGWWTGSSAIF